MAFLNNWSLTCLISGFLLFDSEIKLVKSEEICEISDILFLFRSIGAFGAVKFYFV